MRVGAAIALALLSFGAKNLLDDHYELGWGLPQPGRTFHAKLTLDF